MIWQVWGERQDGTQRLLHVVYREEAAEMRKKQAQDGKQFQRVFITMRETLVYETT